MINFKDIGQSQVDFLRKAYEHKKLAHSYLFVDNNENKALATAYWLACLYNCQGQDKPDGVCQNCRQILSSNHPDVLLVKPEGRQTIGIDQIRPLKQELAKSPIESSRRFFFIDEAQKLTLSAANALLNLLEEPIAPVVSILITDNADQILPTIRSRTQIISFTSIQTKQNKSSLLRAAGFSKTEIADLENSASLDNMIKYFYQEMLERNDLALVTAHKLNEIAKTDSFQRYILFSLKLLAQTDLKNGLKQVEATRMLKHLIEVDKMRFSNINFRNSLDYLALQWKR